MEDIEILDEDFMPAEMVKPKTQIIDLSNIIDESVKEDSVISLDRLFTDDEEVIDVYEEELEKEKKREKKIGRIQIALIVFLIVAASLIYLFGYDFFEPFIKID